MSLNEFIYLIDGNSIILQNGTSIKADAIIFCTGYETTLPFLSKEILDILSYLPQNQYEPLLLHKTVFPPSSLKGLAFVGLNRGNCFGTTEMQALWASRVFSKILPSPKEEEIQEGILESKMIRDTKPRKQFSHGYLALTEELAKYAGVQPDYEKLKKESPDLYEKIWNGPFCTASFRLTGYGCKPELALQIINKIDKFVQ